MVCVGGGRCSDDVVFRTGAEWDGSCEGLATGAAGGRTGGAVEEETGRGTGGG